MKFLRLLFLLCALVPSCEPAFAAQEVINIGTNPNDGTGDTLRAAFTKSNANFTDLYSQVATKGAGTVTSVSLAVPSFLSVSGSPVTSSGAITITLANESANVVFAGPSSGSSGAPLFRALVAADIPPLSYLTGNQTVTISGDASGSGATAIALTVTKINGVTMAGLSTGIVKNTTGTGAPSIAVPGTDYLTPTGNGSQLTGMTSSQVGLGNVQNTALSTWAGSSSLTTFSGGTFGSAAAQPSSAFEVPITFGTGLTRSGNTVTVNTTQNITRLSNLTSNGFVKSSGGNGALSVDTSVYLTGNQTITVGGDATGSGATTIILTVGKINGVSLAGLATGILKNTTGTGAPSIATAGTDYLAPGGNGSALTGIVFSQIGSTPTTLAGYGITDGGGGGGGGGSIAVAQTAFLSPIGDDGTGAVGDPTKPFATAQAACDAGAAVLVLWPNVSNYGAINESGNVTVSLIGYGASVSQIGTITAPNVTIAGNGISMVSVFAINTNGAAGANGTDDASADADTGVAGSNGAMGGTIAIAGISVVDGLSANGGAGGNGGRGGDADVSINATAGTGGTGGQGGAGGVINCTDCYIVGNIYTSAGADGSGGTGGNATDPTSTGNMGSGGAGGNTQGSSANSGGSLSLLRSQTTYPYYSSPGTQGGGGIGGTAINGGSGGATGNVSSSPGTSGSIHGILSWVGTTVDNGVSTTFYVTLYGGTEE